MIMNKNKIDHHHPLSIHNNNNEKNNPNKTIDNIKRRTFVVT